MSSAKTLRVVAQVEIADGRMVHAPGAEIDLPEEDALVLIDVGSAARVHAKISKGPGPATAAPPTSTNNPVTESGKAKAPAVAGSNAAAGAERQTSATPSTTTAKSEGAKAKPPRGKAGKKPAAPPAA